MTARHEWLRRSAFVIRCSFSAALAYGAAEAAHLSYPIWALISAIVVSQEQLTETWTFTGRRIAGTILGVAVALSVHQVASYFALRTMAQVVLSVALCAAIVHRLPAMRVSMWTCAIVLLTAAPAEPLYRTGLFRGTEVILGCLIGGTLHQAAEKMLGFVERWESGPGAGSRADSSAEE